MRKLKLVFFVLLIMLVLALVVTGKIVKISYREFPVLLNSKFIMMQFNYLETLLEYRGKLGNVDIASASTAESIPVLVYHGISEESDKSNVPADGVNISPAKFAEHMLALKRAGYRTVSALDLYKFMKGEASLPEKSVLITFDDGRKDSFYPADPVLRVLGFQATMFTISKFSFGVPSVYYLGPPELHFMKNSGRWEIQSHGYEDHEFYVIGEGGEEGHFLTNLFWLEDRGRYETEDEYVLRIRSDLEKSKKTIEDDMGVEVAAFAFPFGDFGERSDNNNGALKDLLLPIVKSIYKISFFQVGDEKRFTQNYFGQYFGQQSFMARRIELNSSWPGEELIAALERGDAKKLPYNDDFGGDNGWITTWSDVYITGGKITLMSRENETGAAVILDGTYLWRDYELDATAELIKGNNVYIWVRFKDNLNYAACNFISGKLVHIEESIGGKLRVARGITRSEKFPDGEFRVGARVAGRNISCTINGETVVETPFLDPSLDTGGIGFKTWNPVNNSAELAITLLRVAMPSNPQ